MGQETAEDRPLTGPLEDPGTATPRKTRKRTAPPPAEPRDLAHELVDLMDDPEVTEEECEALFIVVKMLKRTGKAVRTTERP